MGASSYLMSGLDVTDVLDAHAAEVFRRSLLAVLCAEPVLEWRMRRVDRFDGINWGSFRQETNLDISVPSRFAYEVLDGISRLALPKESQRGARASGPARARLSELGEDGGKAGSATVYVPVAWVPGPLVGFTVAVQGQETPALSRRLTADLFADVAVTLLNMAAEASDLIHNHEGRNTAWHDIGWMLVATDMTALSRQSLAPALHDHQEGTRNVRFCEWFRDVLWRAGCDCQSAKRVVDGCADRIAVILTKAEETAEAAVAAGICARDEAILNPAVNLLTAFDSYMRLLEWRGAQNLRTVVSADPAGSVESFLFLCEYWDELVHGLLDAEPPRGEEAATVFGEDHASVPMAVLRNLARYGRYWPIVIRIRIDFDAPLRITFTQIVHSPETHAPPLAPGERHMVRHSIQFAGWISERLWRWRTRLGDWRSRRGGGRTVYFNQTRCMRYPLSLHDASSHHVEVACDSSELVLIARSAFIRCPYVEAPKLSDVGHWPFSWVRRRVPPRRVKVGADFVFGRITDDSMRIQHFYTTRIQPKQDFLDRLLPTIPSGDGSQLELVVRYRVTTPVWLATLAVSVLSMLVAWLMVIVSLNEAAVGRYNPLFEDAFKLGLTVVLGSLILLAYEKHQDHLVSSSLEYQSWLVLGSLGFAAIATIGHIAQFHPTWIPLPTEAETWLLNRWEGIATWCVGNPVTIGQVLFCVMGALAVVGLTGIAAFERQYDLGPDGAARLGRPSEEDA
jgi:hypothetical protein